MDIVWTKILSKRKFGFQVIKINDALPVDWKNTLTNYSDTSENFINLNIRLMRYKTTEKN